MCHSTDGLIEVIMLLKQSCERSVSHSEGLSQERKEPPNKVLAKSSPTS